YPLQHLVHQRSQRDVRSTLDSRLLYTGRLVRGIGHGDSSGLWRASVHRRTRLTEYIERPSPDVTPGANQRACERKAAPAAVPAASHARSRNENPSAVRVSCSSLATPTLTAIPAALTMASW